MRSRGFLQYRFVDGDYGSVMWRLNPNQNSHFTDSFIEISHFYQGYVDNEINLNPEDNCRKSCDEYTIARHYHCADETFCAGRENQREIAKSICNGSVLNCQYMGGDLSFCPAVSSLCPKSICILLATHGDSISRH